MGRAEAGTPKAISNALKSKGLQRLRWYCSACQKQMRDENGFKCHTQSESHVRQMNLIGENPTKYIQNYSSQFLHDFITLLRTSHGEKKIHFNQFYQEYIRDKNHIHMNATRWHTLSEFCKYLGREGICRVEETEKGFFIAYIDKNPEALKRADALRRKELQDRSDEEQRQRLLKEQIERAHRQTELNKTDVPRILERKQSEPIQLKVVSKLQPEANSAATKNAEAIKGINISMSAPTTKPTASKRKNVFSSMGKRKHPSGSAEHAPDKRRPPSAIEEIISRETRGRR
ncbi:hypothetical protein SJAG_03840 [Schizosaccharomyces japonicus yFS275]|uniref:C2H2-type domain-containing protein n=1 Tax=Schizosaccharomyces japonicus (strain yFS275 / FY16936) TaxID=402676 RepID=B6K571_SCHJY|nr:hypothetical protein SJAG_03840 [Schizosaccharomyces japonicus yFS275]EEB08675.1 hypothetical protein SJAG_03840 [Schizosaccharomyces japonicus yFS275]